MKEENVSTWKGNRLWPTHKLGPKGCTECSNNTSQTPKTPNDYKGITMGLIMRSALPEELEN